MKIDQRKTVKNTVNKMVLYCQERIRLHKSLGDRITPFKKGRLYAFLEMKEALLKLAFMLR